MTGALEGVGGHERGAHGTVPCVEREDVADVGEVVPRDALDVGVGAGVVGGVNVALEACLGDEAFGFGHVAAPDLPGGDDCAVFDFAGADDAALSAEEYRGVVEQHAARDVADKRGGGFVALGREVEVDVG